LSGIRYYSIGRLTVTARSSSGQISYLAGDQHGTQTLAVNANTSAVTGRYYDPHGNPVGTPASASGWQLDDPANAQADGWLFFDAVAARRSISPPA
jgi:hypothetical protein